LTLIWVNLPILPPELWNNNFLWDVGNYLGKNLLGNPAYKYSVYHSMDKILVNLDLSKGLAECIDVEVGDWEYNQTLDYINVPFQCV
jgi:hypothetical protein